ncbi:MAG: hypothetical protein ABSD08_03825, partial [Xanthobacteraceae bacterium]
LGLPRLKTGCPGQPGHPIPAGIGRHPTPTALTAASFAPITSAEDKVLKKLMYASLATAALGV